MEFKVKDETVLKCEEIVLIESDWNLKYHLCMKTLSRTCRINRIRLEFKVFLEIDAMCSYLSINRIRLEFKAPAERLKNLDTIQVLIESDWNLK